MAMFIITNPDSKCYAGQFILTAGPHRAVVQPGVNVFPKAT